ncbi:DUF1573 domain-containing protein [Candidatus Laterigemmans baculatus]|uniref:DUF1573 domain-containing protein n=1 Tax=Candidatus Laterigemmans baculatus TaxID=2770505 RepID=UPI0013DCDB0F|nr:DUF1573 domain-containing protein [Candidatus Laterigemmans baculatus]
MKAAILFPLLALVAGSAIGATLAYQQYARPTGVLGPFSSAEPMSAAEVDAYLASLRVDGVPKLEIVGGPEYNFGIMRRHAQSTHAFEIRNVGTAPLEMAVTGSTCKCTVGKLEQRSLEPGESTQVKLEWTAKTDARTFSQSATLQTNDPEAGELKLLVEGTVVDLVDAEPRMWDLGDVEASEPLQLRTTLFNHAEEPMEVVDVHWVEEAFNQRSEIEVTQRPVDAATDGAHSEALEAFDVAIQIAPGTTQGTLNRTLRINYRNVGSEENHPPLELVLNARIVGAISLLGGSQLDGHETGKYLLRMGQSALGKGSREKIHVVLRGPHQDSAKLQIGQVEPSDALEAELGEPLKRGSMTLIPLEVRVREEAPEMERTGKTKDDYGLIVIESDNPKIAPVRMAVTFRVGMPLRD